jgi:hypothetical protein
MIQGINYAIQRINQAENPFSRRPMSDIPKHALIEIERRWLVQQ